MPLNLIKTIRELEQSLHQPAIRSSREKLEQLLHPDFMEIGRSGRQYDKKQIIEMMLGENEMSSVLADSYALSTISDGVLLLTYRSSLSDNSGKLYRQTLRSSLWVDTPKGWQIRFHQGTPI